jgi:hypothetical protein
MKAIPSVRRRWLLRVKHSRAALLKRECKHQPAIKNHFKTTLINRTARPLIPPYLTPLRKQTMLSGHFSHAPKPG